MKTEIRLNGRLVATVENTPSQDYIVDTIVENLQYEDSSHSVTVKEVKQ